MTGTKSFNNMICVNHATEQMKCLYKSKYSSLCVHCCSLA